MDGERTIEDAEVRSRGESEEVQLEVVRTEEVRADEVLDEVALEEVAIEEVALVDESLETIKEVEEEENLIMTALFSASEEGNVDGITKLLDNSPNFDINQSNKDKETALHIAAGGGHLNVIKLLHERGITLSSLDKNGDTAVYWATRQGHVEVIKFLKTNDVCLNTQNKSGEAAIHVAARYGHAGVIEYLCQAGADINLQDKLGETALHTAAWHGLPPAVCAQLCAAGCKVDIKNKEQETPLHCASARGNLDCVKVLLSHGASLNVIDKNKATPLHLACRRRHVPIALLLVHSSCALDALDVLDETPLHPACREGLLPVVQTMCAFGCQVDVVNKGGSAPLHVAAKSGHLEIVRCLVLSGAEPEQGNKEGIAADIMAIAQGHNMVAELLTRMKPEKRETCIRQLIPTTQPLNRIKVKVFGHTGSGKSMLIDSLKCGYFGSFFRKSRLASTAPPVTPTPKAPSPAERNGTAAPNHSTKPPLTAQLSYDTVNESYTHGIEVQQVTLTGPGDLSVWEFSGYEPYLMLYDHFIGDPNCAHIITFSLAESQEDQLAHLQFWFNFIKSRIAPMEPIGQGGTHPWPPHVVMVATHGDQVGCTKDSQGLLTSPEATLLFETMCTKYSTDFHIYKQVFVVDGQQAMSSDMKALRTALTEMKTHILKCLPRTNGFLDATVAALPMWRKVLASYPVVTWPAFIEYARSKVNLLASEEHFKELMCQLQLVGEVVYIETDTEEDLVVLNPEWLCTDVLGQLLCRENIAKCRPTGCFSADDVQFMFPEADAKELLGLLEALELCTCCEVDEELEYEFPALNFTETIQGLWEQQDVYSLYGGIRLQCPAEMNDQLIHLFPRIQVRLRGDMIDNNNGPDWDLYQWYHGSKICHGQLEALLSLTSDREHSLELLVRGNVAADLFHFRRHILDIMLDVLEDSCPGLVLQCDYLSPSDLLAHNPNPKAYSPKQLLTMQTESLDKFMDIVCCKCEQVTPTLIPGMKLHVTHLSIHSRRQMARMLDYPDQMGRDWCMLAVCLGLTDSLPQLDQRSPVRASKTDAIMAIWSRDPSATLQQLLAKLEELGRPDVVDAVMATSPLYRLQLQPPAASPASDQTLSTSSISR